MEDRAVNIEILRELSMSDIVILAVLVVLLVLALVAIVVGLCKPKWHGTGRKYNILAIILCGYICLAQNDSKKGGGQVIGTINDDIPVAVTRHVYIDEETASTNILYKITPLTTTNQIFLR